MAEVYTDLQEAIAVCARLPKRYRVYRVRLGKRAVFVPASEPRAAMGIAGPHFGLIAEPAVPRILTAEQREEIEALAQLSDSERAKMRKMLGLE
jgi:hypothetical protein